MEFEEPQTHKPEGRQSVGATVGPQEVPCIAASIFYAAFSWGTASCVCVVWMCGHTCVERTEDILNDVLRTPFIWTIF